MYIAQDKAFNQNVDDIIRGDEAHPILAHMTIPVLETKGKASDPEILPERMIEADKTPLKVVSIDQYNQVAKALRFPVLDPIEQDEAVAIRPMYTDYEWSDYEGETVDIELPDQRITLAFAGMTVERIINWSYPDVMIVVSNGTFDNIEAQVSPTRYVGYAVQEQKTTKHTADVLAALKTPESNLSSFIPNTGLGSKKRPLMCLY